MHGINAALAEQLAGAVALHQQHIADAHAGTAVAHVLLRALFNHPTVVVRLVQAGYVVLGLVHGRHLVHVVVGPDTVHRALQFVVVIDSETIV